MSVGAVPEVWLRVGDEDGDRYVADARAEITQFKVFTRVRPFIAEEKKRFGGDGELAMRSVVEMSVEDTPQGPVETTFVCDPKDGWRRTHSFTYDRCIWSIPDKLIHTCRSAAKKTWVNQAEMYKVATTDDGGYSCVDNAFLGINSHIMTYGQTSSGKTYTMLGNWSDQDDNTERGIIPRVCDELFRKVAERNAYEARKPDPRKRWKLDVSVSFIEIYCEKVRNLLDESIARRPGAGTYHGAGDVRGGQQAMKEAKIRGEGSPGGPYLEGVEPKRVLNWDDCKRYLKIGSRHRTTAATLVHDQSSRSHAMFTVILTQTREVQGDGAHRRHDRQRQQVKVGRINLVDLAGSERGGGTDYQVESSAINTSLLVLRKVIDALAERQTIRFEQLAAERRGLPPPQRRPPEVPQRESVLTRLLDLEGANAKAVMIANLTPSHEFYDETLRTLEWSHKSRRLVTVVRANTSDSAEVLEGRMNAMNQKLMGHLADQKSNVDSLQAELKLRAQMIKDLTEKNARTEQRIQSLDERHKRARTKRHATYIQLFFYLHMLRKVKARRERVLREKQQQKAAEEERLSRIKLEYQQLQKQLAEQGEGMEHVRARAERMLQELEGRPAQQHADPEEAREQQRRAEEDLRRKTADLELVQQQRKLAEEAFGRFSALRVSSAERRLSEHQDREAQQRRARDDLLQELLQDLTPEEVLGNVGVGPVPEELKAAGESARAGESVRGIRVFQRRGSGSTGPGGAAGWAVSDELAERTQEAEQRLEAARRETEQLAQQKRQLEEETRGLQQEQQKAQDEKVRLSAATKELDNQIQRMEANKGCC